MADRTIRPTEAPAAAPYAYTVTAPEGFTPKAVFVSWDGSGAAGDFLPCVSYYNRDGVLIDRAFPTSGPIVAGDSAGVGYRPFDRGGGGGGSTATLTVTDGTTTVAPTTEIDLGEGEQLVSTGPGVAFVKVRATPFVIVRSRPFTLFDSVGLTVNFHVLANAEAYTNDIPAVGGYRSNAGALFVDNHVWTGDNFTGHTTAATSPFAVRTDRGGAYVFYVLVSLFPPVAAGELDITIHPPPVARIEEDHVYTIPLTRAGRWVYTSSFPAVIPQGAAGGQGDLSVDLFQDSGSDIPNVAVTAHGYRLSPA